MDSLKLLLADKDVGFTPTVDLTTKLMDTRQRRMPDSAAYKRVLIGSGAGACFGWRCSKGGLVASAACGAVASTLAGKLFDQLNLRSSPLALIENLRENAAPTMREIQDLLRQCDSLVSLKATRMSCFGVR
ncbi:hypothetical protein KAK07_23725 [Ideonella sp. 4Y16]|uniref:Uncharacterized protein n=1 Tax=Ideonella alba TaxID=2824118 RepID=A0A941BKY4_9BURK|nr:hypothetical protein [Ideonella alba]MBQ0930619.1 hypothetical protein [Ideonella alba]MBQ0946368.1 hypothetical protein [Ideonella alba]